MAYETPQLVGVQLSPLSRFSSLKWEKCQTLPQGIGDHAQGILLNDRIYTVGGTSGVLYTCMVAHNPFKWTVIPTPQGVFQFTLTSYLSKLVLIGGIDTNTENVTGKLWMLEDSGDWSQSLPPMTEGRFGACAVSIGDYIIVAGGYFDYNEPSLYIEIYDGNCWTIIDEPLPFICTAMKSVVHTEIWYVMGGDSDRKQSKVYCASLRFLIANLNADIETNNWKHLTDIPLTNSSLAIVGDTLISIGGEFRISLDDLSYDDIMELDYTTDQWKSSSEIYSFSPRFSSWKPIEDGNLPAALSSTCAIALPTGEILTIGGIDLKKQNSNQVYKASVCKVQHMDSRTIANAVIKEELAFLKLEFHFCQQFLQKEDSEKLSAELDILKNSLTPNTTSLTLPIEKVTSAKGAEQERLHPIIATKGVRGAESCAKTTITVTNSSQYFHWESYGLTLRFPDGCLPAAVQQCTVTIMASLSGDYEFPAGSHLVSAIYWLRCEPRCQFTKAISVEIEHCALNENISKLSIVRSHCNQEKLPYSFKSLGGSFTIHSSYGYIEVDSFSGYAVIQDGSSEKEYCASLYYLERKRQYPQIHFVLHLNIAAQRTYVQRNYKSEGAISGPDLSVCFESEAIVLDIPQEGIEVRGGWRIEPLTPLVIEKKTVDSFRPRRRIPTCQMQAVLTSDVKKIPVLTQKIVLKGARQPYNCLTISFLPISMQEKQDEEILEKEKLSSPITLKSLFKELIRVAHQWHDIGVLLDIDDGQLEAVKANENSVNACLREMLKLWLRRASPPSWSTLIDAIRTLGNEVLALELQDKYLLP